MYSKLIAASSPGLFIILVDQSGSMDGSYGDTNKAQFAALAVNRTIYEIISSCRKGEKVSDRCYIAVIGYGSTTRAIVGGRPSELEQPTHGTMPLRKKVPDGAGGLVEIEWEMGVWLKAESGGTTPMAAAFQVAGQLIEKWTTENSDTFPPIVINISDGAPDDASATKEAAQKVASLGTSDGNVLIYNCHIGTGTSEIRLPTNSNELPDANAKMLFDISSVIPAQLVQQARNAGLNPMEGSRGLMINASPESLIKLMVFGSGSIKALPSSSREQ